jgi:DMSO/TMAO reductase YedYZ molybdopterin-dependent catalytic subunit
MSPRLTDWSLALTAGIALITGLISLISGHPGEWPIFALHGIAGLWLLLLLEGKLRRVWPRLTRLRLWDRRTAFGVAATLVVALALFSGIAWIFGGDISFAGFNLLNWHIVLGFALALAIIIHMLARAKPLRGRDVRGRRQALQFGALALGSVALWPVQQGINHLLNLPGSRERFTGSREVASYGGNAFPATSWVADQPHFIDPASWHLTIDGAVQRPLTLTYDDIVATGDELIATLDCTGGFYSTQHWQGIGVGRMLDQAGPRDDARHVSFISVTGYRWSQPLGSAREMLLATHVEGEALSHDHGAPARLVAPGQRGFEWVKWVVHVTVLTAPDPGQVVSIFTSSFTPAGHGSSG